jgi:hypothetical protein
VFDLKNAKRLSFTIIDISSFLFWEQWGLNLGLHAYKGGALLLETHLQSIFALVIVEMDFSNYLPSLASHHVPPDFRLPNS